MDVDDVVVFEAKIYQIGQNRCIDVPAGSGFEEMDAPVPVIMTVAGERVKTNLVDRGGGHLRVFVNSDLRRAAAADTGDEIAVELRLDLADREPELPLELERALAESGWATEVFEGLTVNQRREMAAFVRDAAQVPTRLRRVDRVLEVLEEMRRK